MASTIIGDHLEIPCPQAGKESETRLPSKEIRSSLGLGQSGLNSRLTVLAGLNAVYFTVMEINWDCSRFTIITRQPYY